jgi:NAD(P)H-dependent FMN reductase
MNVLMISISGGKPSKSRVLAEHAAVAISVADPQGCLGWLDFAEEPLPPFAGADTWSHPHVVAAGKRIAAADALIIATPIYNYNLPSAAKSLIELTGDGWEEKIVGFLCTAGGARSYMAPLSFANSLMLDYRCLILPRFVYATGDAFSETGDLTGAEIHERLVQFAADLVRLKSWREAAQVES